MIEFVVSFGLMIAGAIFRILWRARKHAGSGWELRVFFADNVFRWAILGSLVVFANLIVYFQPGFVEGLQGFGIPVPALLLGSAGIGLGLGEGVVRTIPTVTRAVNGKS
jgi:hypothetical protein